MKFFRKDTKRKVYRRGDVSYIILFAIAVFSVLLVAGGSTLAGQYSTFGALITSIKAGGNSTVQLHTMFFVTYTPTPTFTPTPSLGPSVSPSVSPAPSTSITPGPSVSPPPTTGAMICGTNLGLFNSSDSFLTASVQNLTKQLHVGLIRMPIRSAGGNSTELQAAQAIKNLGAFPIVILHESNGAGDIANDTQIIQNMNTIFGNSLVYYELGNEPTGGYPPYIANWNAMIPQLKPLATNGKFGGPAFFENFTPGEISGMATFVHTAVPKPDFISWHEYTCGSTNTAAYCYAHLANWATHMQNTKNAITANGDQVPPVFITEWNYDSAAKGTGTDPRIAQLVAMHFVQTALQDLKSNGVTGATQYVLNTNADYNLIDNSGNALTGFGQDFQNTCAGL